jgi:predicted DNA-binding protein
MIQLNIEIPPELKTRYKIAAERMDAKTKDRKVTLKSVIQEVLEQGIDGLEAFCDEMDKMY